MIRVEKGEVLLPMPYLLWALEPKETTWILLLHGAGFFKSELGIFMVRYFSRGSPEYWRLAERVRRTRSEGVSQSTGT